MGFKTIHALSAALGLSLLVSACSGPNACVRKDRWFQSHCTGTDVAYSPDPNCEFNLDHCSAGQVQQFNSYVACIEQQNSCSLDTLNACQAQYPGGVNLMCPG
jgi:hypothetical protein